MGRQRGQEVDVGLVYGAVYYRCGRNLWPLIVAHGLTDTTSMVALYHHAAQNHDQERFFCTNCGTTLYWTISALPDLIGIAGGCFTEPALEEPGQSYAHAQKPPWVVVPAAWACMD